MTKENNSGKSSKNVGVALPKAKLHPMLQRIKRAMKGCHHTRSVDVFGVSYTLRTIDPGDTDWTLDYSHGSSLPSMAQSSRVPLLATALTAVEGLPVEQLFELPEDTDEIVLQMMQEQPRMLKAWRYTQVYEYLQSADQHDDLINKLWACYLEIDKERKEALNAIDPLSKRTQSSESRPTSSPEKEPS